MKSIRTKIMLNIFLCVVLSAGIIGVAASYMNFRTTVSTLEKTLGESAKIASYEVSNGLDVYRMLTQEFAQSTILSGYGGKMAKLAELERMKKTPYIQSVTLLNKDGFSVDGNIDYSSMDTFINARDVGGYFMTDIVVEKESTSLYLSAPVHNNGKFNGAVIVQLNGQILSDIVSKIKIGSGGSAYIVSKDGYTVGSPYYDSVLAKQNTQLDAKNDSSIETLAMIEAAMCRGESGFGTYSYQGVKKMAAYCPIEGTPWAIDVAVTRSDFMEATNLSLTITLVMILIAIFLSALIAHYCARTISAPVVACSERLKKLATGDFASPVPQVKYKDETGSLALSTQTLVTELKQVVTDISNMMGEMASGNFALSFDNQYEGDFRPIGVALSTILSAMNDTLYRIEISSEQVSNGSIQIANSAQALSSGTTQQASAVEQLSASVQEVAGKVQSNAENASQANEKAGGVGKQLGESNRRMTELTQAMEEIRTASREIEKIIKTIEDIAFQTNILALNAAVEAARAGAAGKGFAVVADEVRNLASKSAEASKNTTVLIEKTLQAVERGADLTNTTALSILQVVEGAREIIGTVDKISQASGEQATAISEISIGVDQISSVVQTNSATAEESAAASEQLSSQANELKKMVGQFRLRNMKDSEIPAMLHS